MYSVLLLIAIAVMVWLRNCMISFGGKPFVERDLGEMVAAGDINFTVCDEKVALQLIHTFPEIDTETDISFTQLESWAVRVESPVLLDSLNSWLTRFKETKAFQRLHEKYYGAAG